MTQTELDINAALQLQLSKASEGLDIDVAWPAIPYTPQQGIPYLNPSFLPATNNAASVGKDAKNRATGFYQIQIVIPATEGEGSAKDIFEHIYPYFRRGTVIKGSDDLRIRVTQLQVIPLSGDQADWHTTAVRVVYRSDLTN